MSKKIVSVFPYISIKINRLNEKLEIITEESEVN